MCNSQTRNYNLFRTASEYKLKSVAQRASAFAFRVWLASLPAKSKIQIHFRRILDLRAWVSCQILDALVWFGLAFLAANPASSQIVRQSGQAIKTNLSDPGTKPFRIEFASNGHWHWNWSKFKIVLAPTKVNFFFFGFFLFSFFWPFAPSNNKPLSMAKGISQQAVYYKLQWL